MISFTACIPNANLKQFLFIIQFLLKVDGELIVEIIQENNPEDGVMILRALNDAKSAFALVEIKSFPFFSHMTLVDDDRNNPNSSLRFTCKLFSKVIA